MTAVERYYARWGYTRGPTEGFFAYRLRCETCSGLRMVDENPLRERLYDMWTRQVVVERPQALPIYASKVVADLMDRVSAQFAGHFVTE